MEISLIEPSEKHVVFVPSHTPNTENPTDFSERASARFIKASLLINDLRSKHGRNNVILVMFGGWALHNRIPLAVHHLYAATQIHKIFKVEDFDLIAACGINTVTDLLGTFDWLKQNISHLDNAYIITSKGHAQRTINESSINKLFKNVYHVESQEKRDHPEEDTQWQKRRQTIPSHQATKGGRHSDILKFGSQDSLKWSKQMQTWAETNPQQWQEYNQKIWELTGETENKNVVIISTAPGCWKLKINN